MRKLPPSLKPVASRSISASSSQKTKKDDDGVKVNYGKFGDLLEGVKIVTGGASDD